MKWASLRKFSSLDLSTLRFLPYNRRTMCSFLILFTWPATEILLFYVVFFQAFWWSCDAWWCLSLSSPFALCCALGFPAMLSHSVQSWYFCRISCGKRFTSVFVSLFHPRAIWEMYFGKIELYQTLHRESILMVKGNEKFWTEIARSVYFFFIWSVADNPICTEISSLGVFITKPCSPIGVKGGGSTVCFFITDH